MAVFTLRPNPAVRQLPNPSTEENPVALSKVHNSRNPSLFLSPSFFIYSEHGVLRLNGRSKPKFGKNPKFILDKKLGKLFLSDFCKGKNTLFGKKIVFLCYRNYGFDGNFLLQGCNSSEKEKIHAKNREIGEKSNGFLDAQGMNVGKIYRKMPDAVGLSENSTEIHFSFLNGLIREYTENGSFEDAIGVYLKMLNFKIRPNKFSILYLIKAFGGLCDSKNAKLFHGHVAKIGMTTDIYIVNSLLAMYCKCGAIEDALDLFDKMPEPDLVSWNTIIGGFEQLDQPTKALALFRQMQQFRIKSNIVTCLAVLSSCASCGVLLHGREIHCFSIKNGFDSDLFLGNQIIDMYMKCKDPNNAERVCGRIAPGNTVTWNVMISGYVHNGFLLEALIRFHEMLVLAIEPNSSTIVCVLELCSKLSNLGLGKQIHSHLIKNGSNSETRVETSLVDMYCKCGNVEGALQLFERFPHRSFVMWGAIIAGCAQNGRLEKALELFALLHLEGRRADSEAAVTVLRICSQLKLGFKGKEIHGFSTRMGFDSDVFVGSALTDMYAKCGDMGAARKVLLRLPLRDVVSWNALILGYTQTNHPNDALKAFQEMQLECVRPNSVTIASVLAACAQLSVLIQCREIHNYSIRNGFGANILVCNSLIAAYARCGDINHARLSFKSMPVKDEISWNSMLSGLGMHGHTDDMFALFDKMKLSGIKPDHVTFTGILFACSHTGRVNEGMLYFKSMSEEYNIVPTVEHYTCMVDLLGRAGHLDHAYDLITHMPCKPDAHVWGSLLGSCKIHGNRGLAECVAKHIFELDSENIGYHVLLANIFADFGKWDGVMRIRGSVRELGLKKSPGCSWIVVNNKIYTFIARDRSHYKLEEIYATLANLTEQIKGAGYIPQLHFSSTGDDEVIEQGDLQSSVFENRMGH